MPKSAKNSVLKVTTKTTPSPNFVQYEFVIRNTKSEDVGMTALEFGDKGRDPAFAGGVHRQLVVLAGVGKEQVKRAGHGTGVCVV